MVKKVLGLMIVTLAMLCMLSGSALAADWESVYPKAAADRLGVELPAGMKATVTKENGKLTVVINSAETDWEKVMLGGNYPLVRVRPYVERPSTTWDTCLGFNGGIFDCAANDFFVDFTGALTDPERWNSGNTKHSNGTDVGKVVAEKSLLIPNDGRLTEGRRGDGFFICWMDKDAYQDKYPGETKTFIIDEMMKNEDELFYYEYVELEIYIDTTESFYVPFKSLAKTVMAPTRGAGMPDGLQVQTIENGDITFQYTGSVTDVAFPMVLNVPSGASTVELYSPDRGETVKTLAVTGGGTVSFTLTHGVRGVLEEQYVAIWKNGDEVVNFGMFYLHCEPATYQPWPYYVSNWSKPEAARVQLINGSQDIGVSLTYDAANGIVNVGYAKDMEVTGELGDVICNVVAPSWAKAYRMNHSGGNNIMGNQGHAADQDNIMTGRTEVNTVKNGVVQLFRTEPLQHYQAGPIDVFIQLDTVWKYGGGVYLIYWYDSEEAANSNAANPRLIEYVVDTTEEICVTTRTEIVEKEDDIQAPVKHVTCVKPGHSGKDWHLVIHRYPQRGQNACHWEFYLENECGDYQPLGEKTVFYMPYPDGHRYAPEKDRAYDNSGNECTYKIYHYNANHDKCEEVTATPTSKGIRFETSSLSPFVLDWGDSQGDDGNNQGDDGNQDGNNNRKYNVHKVRLDRGNTTINGGSIRNLEINTDAQVQINGGRFENLSIDFSWEENPTHHKTVMSGGSVETLNLMISNRTPVASTEGVIAFGADAAVGNVFIAIFDGEEAPKQPITGVLATFPEGTTVQMLCIEGDPLLYTPNWFGNVTFEEVQVPDREPMSYADFLAYLEALENAQ